MRAARGNILRGLGCLEEAEQELDRASQLARAEDEPECLCITTLFRGILEDARGDAEAQLRCAREALEMAERLGAPFWRLLAYEMLTQSLLESEEWNTALGVARQLEAFVSERLPARALVFINLARAHLGLGDFANAQAAAADALAAAERLPSMKQRGSHVRLNFANVLLATQGAAAREAAEREIAIALELLEVTGLAAYRPRVHETRAELMRVLGDRAGRERELREAHRLYTEMSATGHAERLAKELSP
jgi:tetratricopeptide (TPR) repeat protein